MTYDLNDTKRYTVWACSTKGEDLVCVTGLTLWDADLVCNEMNSLDDEHDYRVAVMDGAEMYHKQMS
jgi:hypothetical protein